MQMKESDWECVSFSVKVWDRESERSISQPSDTVRVHIYILILISRCTLRLKYRASDIKVPSSGGGGSGSNKTHTRFHYANNSTQQRHTREVQRSLGNRHEPLCIFFSSKLNLFSERAHVGFLPVCIVHAVLIYIYCRVFVCFGQCRAAASLYCAAGRQVDIGPRTRGRVFKVKTT